MADTASAHSGHDCLCNLCAGQDDNFSRAYSVPEPPCQGLLSLVLNPFSSQVATAAAAVSSLVFLSFCLFFSLSFCVDITEPPALVLNPFSSQVAAAAAVPAVGASAN